MTILKRIFKMIPKPKLVIPVALVLLLIIISSAGGNGNNNGEIVTVTRKNIEQKVSVTGRVQPSASVELAFEQSGRVQSVPVKVGARVYTGQLLIQLTNDELMAQLAEAEAKVKAQQAKLDELKRGTRDGELLVQEAKVADAKQGLVDAIRDAYTKSDDAIRNKTDQFISNPNSASPSLMLTLNDSSLENSIESGRLAIEQTLLSWKLSIDGLSVSANLTDYTSGAKTALNFIRAFMDKVGLAVNGATPNTLISQSTLDSYKADVSTARTNVNTAVNNLSAAEAELAVASNQLQLLRSGTASEQITAQEAALEQAVANTLSIKAQLAKYSLRSPMNGILTKQEAKIGQIVTSGLVVAAVISEAEFEIKVNVPEADVAKLKVGNMAEVRLDAYDSGAIFTAKIVGIDPAETFVEGVATYKTTFQFTQKDSRIRSGMTANVEVLADSRTGVLVIPQRAVMTKDNLSKVLVFVGDETDERAVLLGLRGSSGEVEVLGGLQEGEKVFIPSRK